MHINDSLCGLGLHVTTCDNSVFEGSRGDDGGPAPPSRHSSRDHAVNTVEHFSQELFSTKERDWMCSDYHANVAPHMLDVSI